MPTSNWYGVTSSTPNFMFGGVMVGGPVTQPDSIELLYVGRKDECETQQKLLKKAQKKANKPANEESISDMAFRLRSYRVVPVYVSLRRPIVL